MMARHRPDLDKFAPADLVAIRVSDQPERGQYQGEANTKK
jgi:hypothetical protein